MASRFLKGKIFMNLQTNIIIAIHETIFTLKILTKNAIKVALYFKCVKKIH